MSSLDTASEAPRPSLSDLFTGFLKIGLMGFGGVGPIARHIIVTERNWLDDRGYAELIGICQALPGANTVNAAVMLGDRFRGGIGALTCVFALMAMPLLCLVGLANAYDAVSSHPLAQVALTGAAASAAGLILGTAVRLLTKAGLARWAWIMAAAAFIAVGLLRLPMLPTLLVLVPLGLAAATLGVRRA
ncbi:MULTISPECIES: chromate transporter [Bosea]|uniref:chromate transporter n=1 Tax=Bosea TaxID=85413 RepID=UPI00214F9EC5|nr:MULTISPECIES: chromate transporter [Bosea]MCR4522800.1 chromate transporter [Bosea sp. 47.2.35]MDR6826571.1 chromate transporter [Bosea robiniae]MDR6893281.1 chromate transporter [Bosea sp. BE109]MDR7137020.1 chromate transporter [Bosea sp. BE168]MDR7173719.1 chromate transporter [Bosea sp. BE271]